MKKLAHTDSLKRRHTPVMALGLLSLLLMLLPLRAAAQDPDFVGPLPDPDPIPMESPVIDAELVVPVDTTMTVVVADNYPYGLDGKIPFNPDPTRAVWMSVLCPGAGQIYNRRYWKIPIVVGGFMGLGYATNWTNGQFQDYSQAYRDLLDNDPNTNSYMDFFPPGTQESSLDKSWLQQVFKSRKDYYRRNRDLCIIGLVALYLINVVDAYVDASLAHFDISPDLSMHWGPALIPETPRCHGAIGLNWALTF